MTPTSKMLREPAGFSATSQSAEDDGFFDFGEPEIIAVELTPGRFLSLKEPTANDLISINKISEDKNLSELEITLQTICILHTPEPGGRKLSLKDAKKLRPRQLKMIGEAVNQLLGGEDAESEEESNKNDG